MAIALMVTVVSCGPSAEEKIKLEEQAKKTADSIENALKQSMEAVATDTTKKTTDTAATAAPAAEKH